LLTFNGPIHDDELVSSIGVVVSADTGMGTITGTDHLAAGGLDGSFQIYEGTQTMNLVG